MPRPRPPTPADSARRKPPGSWKACAMSACGTTDRRGRSAWPVAKDQGCAAINVSRTGA
jgi:hypothetical protein